MANTQKLIVSILIIGVTLIIGIFIFATMGTEVFSEDEVNGSSQSILSNNGTTIALSPVGEGITSSSATKKNQTWLNFNEDRVQINDNTNYSQPFTISLWINKPLISDAFVGYPITKYNSVGDERSWVIHTNNGNDIVFQVFHNGSSTNFTQSQANNVISANTWYHIATKWNGSDTFVYLNGVIQDSDTSTNGNFIFNGNANVTLGNAQSNLGFYNGNIDDIQIYNYSLRTEQIRAIYNSNSRIKDRKIPILSYHQIENPASAETIVNLTEFEAQMDYLNSSGFETITLENYINWTQGNFNMPKKAVIIMFDDGFSNILNGSNIMDNYNFFGVVGIISESVGDSGRLSWEDLTTLKDRGWEMVSHSINTTHLEDMNIANRDLAFSNSKSSIEGNLSINVLSFVYPGNSHNSTIDAECSSYYTLCTGDASGDLAPYYTYKNSNLTGGIDRLIIDNETLINDFKEVVDEFYNSGIKIRLNENQGIIVHDISNNGNNGIISGATWKDDSIDITLTEDIDYTLANSLFTIVDDDYSWVGIDVEWDYNYQSRKTGYEDTQTIISGLSGGTSWLVIILTVGFAAIIIGILTNNLNKERENQYGVY